MKGLENTRLGTIVDHLKILAEPKDKRFQRINELIGLFSEDKSYAQQVLKDTFFLWKESQDQTHIRGEDLASKLLRIDNFNNSPDYERSKEKIKSLLTTDSEPEYHTFSNSSNDPAIVRERYPKELKNHLQEVLTAYLFTANRQLYYQEGGAKYDLSKEKRQIKAVLAALEGRHIHMGTGEGKSSTVIPIAAIIESVTSEKKDAVVVSISTTLLDDMKRKTEKLLSMTKKDSPDFDLIFSFKKETESRKTLDDSLFKKMQVEALINSDGQYSETTNKSIIQQHWENLLEHDTEKQSGFPNKNVQPRIVFATERDLVFQASEDPSSFVKKCPKIFMDEADIAYNRRSPYVKNMDDNMVSEEEIRASTYQWLLTYMVSQQLGESDFDSSYGTFRVKSEVINRLNLNFAPDNTYFDQGVKIIAKQLDIDSNDIILLQQNAGKFLSDFSKEADFEYMLNNLGDIIAETYKTKGRLYLFNDQGKMQIRDSYTDELLEHHQFQPEQQLAVSGLSGKYEFVQINKAAFSTVKFPTFVTWLKDQLVCLSGTLLYPDPKTKKLSHGNFAKFLEEATDRKIVLITPPEIKTVPQPFLFQEENEAINRLDADLNQSKKPALIIDYEGVEHTNNLYQVLKARQAEKKIIFLPPKPSKPDEEKKYNEFLEKITHQLAEGEIDIIISSGTAGTGVNIVKSDGAFPDLEVVIFGMPENDMQLTQGVGRRRLEGDNSSWYLSMNQIERFISLFSEEQASKLEIAFGTVDQQKIRELLNNALVHPEKTLDVILEILKQKKRNEAENNEITTQYDNFYRELMSLFGKKLYKKLPKTIPDKDRRKRVFRLMGLPDNLYFDIPTIFRYSATKGGAKNYITELKNQIFNRQSGENQDWLTSQVDSWYDLNIKKTQGLVDLLTFSGKIHSQTKMAKVQLGSRTFDESKVNIVYSIGIFPPIDGLNPVIVKDKWNSKTPSFIGIEKDGQFYPVTNEKGEMLLDNYSRFSFFPLANKNQLIVFANDQSAVN